MLGRTYHTRVGHFLWPNCVDWMASVASMPNVVAFGENSARYSRRADIGQNPMHTEAFASSMWSLVTMDLEIVPTHSGIDTPKHIDPKFLLVYSIVLRMGQHEREKKNTKIGKVKNKIFKKSNVTNRTSHGSESLARIKSQQLIYTYIDHSLSNFWPTPTLRQRRGERTFRLKTLPNWTQSISISAIHFQSTLIVLRRDSCTSH